MSVLLDAVKYGSGIEMIHRYLDEGFDPDIKGEHGLAALHFCAAHSTADPSKKKENLDIAKLLIKYGANVDVENNWKNSPLHLAIIFKNYDMLSVLMEAKCDINHADQRGNAAIHISVNMCYLWKLYRQDNEHNCSEPHSDIIAINKILENHPLINLKNDRGETALLISVKENDFPVVKILLRNNASPSIQNMCCCSPIFYAMTPTANLLTFLALLKCGADHLSSNELNITPLENYLQTLENTDLIEIKKAKFILKMLIFKKNSFKQVHLNYIQSASEKTKIGLYSYFELSRIEVELMKKEEIEPSLSVYDVVARNFFNRGAETLFPEKVYENIFEKLLKNDYKIYDDVLSNSILRAYLLKKLSEVNYFRTVTTREDGTTQEQIRRFLNVELRHYICRFLSKFDIMKCIIAFSEDCKNIRRGSLENLKHRVNFETIL